jgi:hypothetical protein
MITREPQTDLQDLLNRLGVTGPAARWLTERRALVQRERATQPAQPSKAAPVRPVRALLLWIFSAPLLFAAVTALAAGRFAGFIGDALAWSLIAVAALLTRRASLAAARLQERRFRRFGRQWRLPLRNLAAALLGLGTGTAAVLGAGHLPAIGVGFAAVAVLGYHLVYGLEPFWVGERPSAPDKESRAVLEALAEAEDRLINIERAAQSIRNSELSARLARIADLGRGILAQIAERPSDLRRARRFLTVFLEGAEQVSDGYARTHHYADSAGLEQNFRTVLITIEDQFARQRERLREADVLDLDVQIEVLKKQLDQEGIR